MIILVNKPRSNLRLLERLTIINEKEISYKMEKCAGVWTLCLFSFLYSLISKTGGGGGCCGNVIEIQTPSFMDTFYLSIMITFGQQAQIKSPLVEKVNHY